MEQSVVVEKMYAKGHICPYCHRTPRLVDSIEIYRNKSFGYVWFCSYCNAYAPSTSDHTEALGPLADPALRKLQRRVSDALNTVAHSKSFPTLNGKDRTKKVWAAILDEAKIPSDYTVYQMRPAHCAVFLKACEKYLGTRFYT